MPQNRPNERRPEVAHNYTKGGRGASALIDREPERPRHVVFNQIDIVICRQGPRHQMPADMKYVGQERLNLRYFVSSSVEQQFDFSVALAGICGQQYAYDSCVGGGADEHVVVVIRVRIHRIWPARVSTNKRSPRTTIRVTVLALLSYLVLDPDRPIGLSSLVLESTESVGALDK